MTLRPQAAQPPESIAGTRSTSFSEAENRTVVVGRRRHQSELLEFPDDLQGLIFDVDGTLVDTMPLHYESMKWTFENVAQYEPYNETQFYELAGMSTPEVIRVVSEQQPPPPGWRSRNWRPPVPQVKMIEAFRTAVGIRVREKLNGYLASKPVNGAILPTIKIAIEARKKGIPLVAATSGVRRNVRAYAEAMTDTVPIDWDGSADQIHPSIPSFAAVSENPSLLFQYVWKVLSHPEASFRSKMTAWIQRFFQSKIDINTTSDHGRDILRKFISQTSASGSDSLNYTHADIRMYPGNRMTIGDLLFKKLFPIDDGMVVTIEDVWYGKPDPELFLQAAKKIGVVKDVYGRTPLERIGKRCRVYEDAELGFEAAVAAWVDKENIIDVRTIRGVDVFGRNVSIEDYPLSESLRECMASNDKKKFALFLAEQNEKIQQQKWRDEFVRARYEERGLPPLDEHYLVTEQDFKAVSPRPIHRPHNLTDKQMLQRMDQYRRQDIVAGFWALPNDEMKKKYNMHHDDDRGWLRAAEHEDRLLKAAHANYTRKRRGRPKKDPLSISLNKVVQGSNEHSFEDVEYDWDEFERPGYPADGFNLPFNFEYNMTNATNSERDYLDINKNTEWRELRKKMRPQKILDEDTDPKLFRKKWNLTERIGFREVWHKSANELSDGKNRPYNFDFDPEDPLWKSYNIRLAEEFETTYIPDPTEPPYRFQYIPMQQRTLTEKEPNTNTTSNLETLKVQDVPPVESDSKDTGTENIGLLFGVIDSHLAHKQSKIPMVGMVRHLPRENDLGFILLTMALIAMTTSVVSSLLKPYSTKKSSKKTTKKVSC